MGEVFVKCGLDERLDTHFNIRFVPAAVAGLCPFVTDNTILIILLFEFVQVNRVDATKAKGEKRHITGKFR